MSPHLAEKLPPRRTAPLATRDAELLRLGRKERKLLEQLAGGKVFLVAATGTRIDVGGWLRQGRVCAACLAGELLLFAAGGQPYGEKAEYDSLGRSLYNHVTGELLLAPARGIRVRRLYLPPVIAYEFLGQIIGATTGKKSEEIPCSKG